MEPPRRPTSIDNPRTVALIVVGNNSRLHKNIICQVAATLKRPTMVVVMTSQVTSKTLYILKLCNLPTCSTLTQMSTVIACQICLDSENKNAEQIRSSR